MEFLVEGGSWSEARVEFLVEGGKWSAARVEFVVEEDILLEFVVLGGTGSEAGLMFSVLLFLPELNLTLIKLKLKWLLASFAYLQNTDTPKNTDTP